jgi:L-lactate utilization protein LutB
MNARDQMLARVRTALGRSETKLPPPVFLSPRDGAVDRVAMFRAALESLGGTTQEVASLKEARGALEPVLANRKVVYSPAPLVQACGFAGEFSRNACADAEIGVSSADFALADTGTLVFLTEPRLVSLLPPRHVTILDRAKILMGLDELFSVVPDPAALSSSMVLVTGPSRTADIEMRLVRGVHGPGEVFVIIVADVTPS